MAAPPPDPGGAANFVLRSISLASIPAAAMLLGGTIPMLSPKTPPKTFAFALQHFAAGMVLAAVSQELVPTLTAAEDHASVLALVIGFVLGVAMMLGIQAVMGDHEHGDESLHSSNGQHSEQMEQSELRTDELLSADFSEGIARLERQRLLGASSLSLNDLEDSGNVGRSARRTTKRTTSMSHFAYVGPSYARHRVDGPGLFTWTHTLAHADLQHPHLWQREEERFSRAQSGDSVRASGEGPGLPRFPWTLCFAVLVDSFMDGLLIGISMVVGSAGLPFAVAIAVEMLFLGLTFATAVLPHPRHRAAAAAVAGPACILAGAVCGGLAARAFTSAPAAMVGCTAFGSSALLYMVAEELLLAAHEEGRDHVWWIDVQVYTGFLASILMEKAIRAQGLRI